MRDIIVTLVVLGSLPFILRKPWIGILMWCWISLMNPHRMSWGFATDLPFAQTIAIVTVIGLLFYRGEKKIKLNSELFILLVLIFWFFITTINARYGPLAWDQFSKVYKIQFLILLTIMLIRSRLQLNWLIITVVISLGIYGVKGGVFTILSGGAHRVWGPPGTFIGGNNEIGLAMLMVLPLMRYLQLEAKKRWQKHLMLASMVLTTFAILGTHSRGALVGFAAMSLVFFWRSKNKLSLLLIAGILLPVLFSFMPAHWHERMQTIQSFDTDKSALNRLDSWRYAIDVAAENPLLGDGFEAFAGRTDAHSIYFEILGEHGYVGLVLFLTLGCMCLFATRQLRVRAQGQEKTQWIANLASMLQVSLISYASCGAFLGLAYFDLYYTIVAIIIILKMQLDRDNVLAVEPRAIASGIKRRQSFG